MYPKTNTISKFDTTKNIQTYVTIRSFPAWGTRSSSIFFISTSKCKKQVGLLFCVP